MWSAGITSSYWSLVKVILSVLRNHITDLLHNPCPEPDFWVLAPLFFVMSDYGSLISNAFVQIQTIFKLLSVLAFIFVLYDFFINNTGCFKIIVRASVACNFQTENKIKMFMEHESVTQNYPQRWIFSHGAAR